MHTQSYAALVQGSRFKVKMKAANTAQITQMPNPNKISTFVVIESKQIRPINSSRVPNLPGTQTNRDN